MRLALLLVFVILITICPDHGEKSTFTGNRKFADRVWYCEYSHPLKGGRHTFWRECH